MKKENFAEIIGNIDERFLSESEELKKESHAWKKWVAMAASFTVIVSALIAMPHLFKGNTVPPLQIDSTDILGNCADTTENSPESVTDISINEDERFLEKVYNYNVIDGKYSTYFSGKVIPEQNISNKLEDVTVNAFWKSRDGVRLTDETLRAEVYQIDGIISDTAVALKFIDKGDALTTTHYYVIMNPSADLSQLNQYIISPIAPNNSGEEAAFEEAVSE